MWLWYCSDAIHVILGCVVYSFPTCDFDTVLAQFTSFRGVWCTVFPHVTLILFWHNSRHFRVCGVQFSHMWLWYCSGAIHVILGCVVYSFPTCDFDTVLAQFTSFYGVCSTVFPHVTLILFWRNSRHFRVWCTVFPHVTLILFWRNSRHFRVCGVQFSHMWLWYCSDAIHIILGCVVYSFPTCDFDTVLAQFTSFRGVWCTVFPHVTLILFWRNSRHFRVCGVQFSHMWLWYCSGAIHVILGCVVYSFPTCDFDTVLAQFTSFYGVCSTVFPHVTLILSWRNSRHFRVWCTVFPHVTLILFWRNSRHFRVCGVQFSHMWLYQGFQHWYMNRFSV